MAISRRFGFDSENYHHLTIADTIDTLGRSVLGLSIGCARCHDHKYDPISMADYYALYGIFASSRYAFPGSEEKRQPRNFVPLLPPAEAEPLAKAHANRLAACDAELKKLEAELAQLDESLKTVNEAAQNAADPPLPNVAELKTRRDMLAAGAAQCRRAKRPPDHRWPLCGRLRRHRSRAGQRQDSKARRAHASGARSAAPQSRDSRRRPASPGRRQRPTGARQLAHARNQPAHRARDRQSRLAISLRPRAGRHAQRFRRAGQQPSHPELLDYLAGSFASDGWSLKRLHRQILLSRVYQLSSSVNNPAAERDPTNRGWWKFDRRRLEAETIRDALLAVADGLDRTPGEAHPFPPRTTWGFTQHAPFKAVYESNRRSVYLMTQRISRHPFLALFDGADPNASTALRSLTTTPAQALFMMNDPTVHQQSAALATRLLAAGADRPGPPALRPRATFRARSRRRANRRRPAVP